MSTSPQASTEAKYIEIAKTVLRGGKSKAQAVKVIDFILQNVNGGTPVDSIKGLCYEIIENFDEGQGSLKDRVYALVLSTNGVFSSTFVRNELHLSTRTDKKNLSTILARMCDGDEPEIERTGKRAGEFRIVDKSFTPITEFSIENSKPVELTMPLKLDTYAKIFKSNIIIMAGEKSTGKTAFALGFATMNGGHEMPVRYISSEFDGGELKERLDNMGIDPDKWIRNIQFGRFRAEAQDAILPDGINIVDFLEVKDGEFYKLGHQIDKIYEKLTTGIALICLQKNPGQELARGGHMTLDKARLYVSLYRDKTSGKLRNMAKIIDCKNPAIKGVNPTGFVSEYKLGGGHHFKIIEDWSPE